MSDVQLYDVENALREVARARRRKDALTAQTTALGNDLSGHLNRHFGPESQETAGIALVLGAASLGGAAQKFIEQLRMDLVAANTLRSLVNILAFAGQRMVLDARAAEGGDSR